MRSQRYRATSRVLRARHGLEHNDSDSDSDQEYRENGSSSDESSDEESSDEDNDNVPSDEVDSDDESKYGDDLSDLKRTIEQQRLEIRRLREALIRCETQPRLHFVYEMPTIDPSSLLFCGLGLVGFDRQRQENVKLARNVKRFVAFYGVPPTSLAPFFNEIKNKYPDIIMKDLLMTVNWLKAYDTHEVLAGRWGYSEEYIAPRVKGYARKIQSFVKEKIRLVFDSRRKLVATLDTVTFLCTEMRLDPNSKWYDPKSNSSGLKYEICSSIEEPRQVWINGPFPGSESDITIFRGGTEDTPLDERDHAALYFQLPEGKVVIADSGYGGEPEKIMLQNQEMPQDMIKWLGRVKARGESLHSRLKSFAILRERFRHGNSTKNKMDLHKTAVEAVCVLIACDQENGRPMFDG